MIVGAEEVLNINKYQKYKGGLLKRIPKEIFVVFLPAIKKIKLENITG